MLRPRCLFLVPLLLSLHTACFREPQPTQAPPPRKPLPRVLPRLGYTIQAGAFAQVENAARLAESLQAQGLEATYFASGQGLYKVRFGDFPTREAARSRAEQLQSQGVIADFYLVRPELRIGPEMSVSESTELRRQLVQTAHSYLGVPYLWGGTTPEGFDCSGLTLSVYRMNGLQLPRSSRDQFQAGTPTAFEQMQPGDLVFFATSGGNRVSHVGMYIGEGAFIHAPSKGRTICRNQLAEDYYRKTFLGARTYL